jgi:hypothetical protein
MTVQSGHDDDVTRGSGYRHSQAISRLYNLTRLEEEARQSIVDTSRTSGRIRERLFESVENGSLPCLILTLHGQKRAGATAGESPR